jgi:hypothetical protein
MSTSIAVSSTSPASPTTLLTFTIPSAGTWQVTYYIRMQATGFNTFYGAMAIYQGGSQVTNTAVLPAYFNSTTTVGGATGTGSAILTTTGSTTYTIGAWANDPFTCSASVDANGGSGVTWVQLTGGYVGATGPTGPALLGNDTFAVSLGSGTNSIATSADGIGWTGGGTSVFTTAGYGIAWNGSLWVAVGQGTNTLAYSSDGINWIGNGATVFTTAGYGVAWNGEMWVAVGEGTYTIATSVDGIYWTPRSSAGIVFGAAYAVGWNGSYWTVAGDSTSTFAYSIDGIIWEPSYLMVGTITTAYGLAWNGSTWVGVGNGPIDSIAISPDGISWTGTFTTVLTTGYGVAWNGSMFVAVGIGGSDTIATSTDGGYTWIGRGNTIFTTSGRGVAWNGRYWIATGEGTNTLAYSIDGITWTGLGTSRFSTSGRAVASRRALPYVGITTIPPRSRILSPQTGRVLTAQGSLDTIAQANTNLTYNGSTLTATVAAPTESGLATNTWVQTTGSNVFYGTYSSLSTNAVVWTQQTAANSNLITVASNTGTYFVVKKAGVISVTALITGTSGASIPFIQLDVSTAIAHAGVASTTQLMNCISAASSSSNPLSLNWTGVLPAVTSNYYKIKILNYTPTNGRIMITYLGQCPAITGFPY